MSDIDSSKGRLLRRRSFLATVASIAATLTLTRRGYSDEALAANVGSDKSRVSRENLKPTSRAPAAATMDLRTLGPEHQVVSISNLGDTYRVVTASGKVVSYSEFDLRFKTDASNRGPAEHTPVLMPTSSDRAFVVFAAPREISSFIG
ncbi:hypothetical protein [Afipia sp. Root123D2]|uniref:hypothetical protein n=1 Tax=Afipia sp. Root123D2 TaxID=1736436 RepID=UPI0006F49991|nr:hypothetical protein [Afipia sp. Root123D2]MBE0703046.1 hypothetical protein [Afipia sp.]